MATITLKVYEGSKNFKDKTMHSVEQPIKYLNGKIVFGSLTTLQMDQLQKNQSIFTEWATGIRLANKTYENVDSIRDDISEIHQNMDRFEEGVAITKIDRWFP